MDITAIRKYAPAARRDFIYAVTARANALGISENDIKDAKIEGDVAIIGGRAFPADFAARREKIVEAVRLRSFSQVVEEAAYTWFNRFVALRFMELQGWLKCGCMVLGSSSSSGLPEILDHIADLDNSMLPDADLARARELRLSGNREEELYRLLLIAQCNALHKAMPLLFEKVSDASELLLPDNLLYSDSIIRRMVQAIQKKDGESKLNVEVIGWLYQFYISEKKGEVIGKMVNTEDIPAATQLFTPNWIVQYMVQNTLGRLWLSVNKDSDLRSVMPYYIEPAEQTFEVQAAMDAAVPTGLEPEQMTVFDPACGSGHILVEAYNIFKQIYRERGYRARVIPRLILEKNLFGLDIDPRAAQLSQFALLMLARKDDMHILDNPPTMNIMALHTSRKWDKLDGSWAQGNEKVDALATSLLGGVRQTISTGRTEQMSLVQTSPVRAALPFPEAVSKDELAALLQLFADVDTFGSLIRVSDKVKKALPRLKALLDAAMQSSSDQCRTAAEEVALLVRQADLLARQYDCVVANPPYMGSRGMNGKLKEFAKDQYPDSKADLFAMFMERNVESAVATGLVGMITMQSWMFLSSFETLRMKLLGNYTLQTMFHLGAHGFDSIDGEVVQTTAFTLIVSTVEKYKGIFYRLVDEQSEFEKMEAFRSEQGIRFIASAEDFKKIPGSPVAYWVSDKVRNIFVKGEHLKKIGDTRQGMATSDNNRFLRLWSEVNFKTICFNASSRNEAVASGKKWFPYNKGGEFRKWYGNSEFLVNWENDGEELLQYASSLYGSPTRTIKSISEYFKPCISWSKISSSNLAMRFYSKGYIFDVAGCCIFSKDEEILHLLLGFSNTYLARTFLKTLSPTLNFEAGHLAQLPVYEVDQTSVNYTVSHLITYAQSDWDSYETSWDFKSLPLLRPEHRSSSLADTYARTRARWQAMTDEMLRLEEENNRIFIDAYDLQDELTPEVPLKEITLTCNPFYRYGEDAEQATEEGKQELEDKLRADSVKELVSYAIGCMMGRYSLDEEGLVYAAAGNEDFDDSRYSTFPADDDGIIPVMDEMWFEEDAASRFCEFCKVVWGEENLDQNLRFVADQLDPRSGEEAKATIRRWLSAKFFKDWHLKTYKKRPIYWLFSSGRQKAFECLVYLHRFNENTLPRMRAVYVTPLQSKIASRMELLAHQMESATSTSARNALKRQRDTLVKKQDELRRFDELLRHYADQRINLDLDDGVKVNYAKLGGLLAEAKTVTGGKED